MLAGFKRTVCVFQCVSISLLMPYRLFAQSTHEWVLSLPLFVSLILSPSFCCRVVFNNCVTKERWHTAGILLAHQSMLGASPPNVMFLGCTVKENWRAHKKLTWAGEEYTKCYTDSNLSTWSNRGLQSCELATDKRLITIT